MIGKRFNLSAIHASFSEELLNNRRNEGRVEDGICVYEWGRMSKHHHSLVLDGIRNTGLRQG